MSFNLVHIWASMGLMSRLIASILVVMAVMSLAVAIERWIALLRGDGSTRSFIAKAGPAIGAGQLREVNQLAIEHKASPFARVVGPIVEKMMRADASNLAPVERARREAERQKEALGSELRRGLGILASVGSVAPFIGLLGTVVGIISAFQGIAATGSGGLGAVSSGISEALVETALGLCVAIPAVLIFNQLSARILLAENTVARATGELLDELENRFGTTSVTETTQPVPAE